MKQTLRELLCPQPKSKIKAGDGQLEGAYNFYTSSQTQSKFYHSATYNQPALIFGTGGMASVHFCEKPFSTSTDCLVMYGHKGVQLELIYHYLRTNLHILQEGFKGAGLQHISKDYILDIEIDMPNPLVQEQITLQMRLIDRLIDRRKQQIVYLDEAVKSRFIELFGDPKQNPNGYKVVPFKELIEYMGDIGSNGANSVVVEHLDMHDEEDYALMVRFLNFTSNDFSKNVKYISKEAYEFFRKSKIYGGELIFCKIGSAGLSYIMPHLGRPVSLGLNQIMVRTSRAVNMTYLYNYIHTSYGEYLIDGCINGAVTKSITKGALKEIPIVLPPMDQQEQFAAFVEQTDKSKYYSPLSFHSCQQAASYYRQEWMTCRTSNS